MRPSSSFDALSPEVILQAVEGFFSLDLEPTITPYPSYVNRVYGLQNRDGGEYVVKFYRPDRWTREGIEEEHRFVAELAAAEVPVVPPAADEDGDTLGEVTAVTPDGETDYLFALYPRRGGRLFDAEGTEAWLRMGRLLGRLHAVGAGSAAIHRPTGTPEGTTRGQIEALVNEKLVHPDIAREFAELTHNLADAITPLFDGIPLQRIHGDLHRGNILERPAEGLMLIDFDDMVTGPAVQDFWLLLPGHAEECRRELGLLAEGYEDFYPYPREQNRLIEPLRFMRMIHFVSWTARQRGDRDFDRHFPDWGSRSWWVKELEDLRMQAAVIESQGRD